MAKKNEQLVKVEEQVPAHIAQGNEGFENAEQGDLLIPRLAIMQALSPAVVDGVRFAGEAINSLTGDVWIPKGGEELFVPIFHYKEWIEWGDRDSNQGIKGRSMDPKSDLALAAARGEKGESGRPRVTEYHNFVAVLKSKGFAKPVILSCARTNHKHARKLLGLAKYRGNFPLFAGLYSIKVAQETNKKSQSYFVFNFENAGWVTEEELADARHFYELLKSMSWKAAEPAEEHSEETEV